MCNDKLEMSHVHIFKHLSFVFVGSLPAESSFPMILKYETHYNYSEPTVNTTIISSTWYLETISQL
jgi:hypothetical protein